MCEYSVLARPDVASIERAIRGEGPGVAVLSERGARSVVAARRLRAARQQAIAEAARVGYVVHRGRSSPRATWDAWYLLCQARGAPAVRAWARGVRSSMIEFDLCTAGPAARLGARAYGLVWALLGAHARGVIGDERSLQAIGVRTDQVEAIARELARAVGATGSPHTPRLRGAQARG